jgi:DNA-directed RNA polymerase specialized sigma24 family protein
MGKPQRGDEAELFASFNDQLVRRVRRAAPWASLENVEDGCAIAWMTFLRNQPDRAANWRGWLVTVAKHEVYGLEKRHRDLSLDEEIATSEGELERYQPQSSPQFRHLELAERLDVLNRVPKRRRDAALLRAIGLSYAEIGQVLGLSYTRTDKLLSEANAYMRADLESRESVHPERLRTPSRRVDQLRALEDDPPRWLEQLIGPPPRNGAAVRLEWRRAALALDDYRRMPDTTLPANRLGERPAGRVAAQRYDRAVDAMERLRVARRMRARALEGSEVARDLT